MRMIQRLSYWSYWSKNLFMEWLKSEFSNLKSMCHLFNLSNVPTPNTMQTKAFSPYCLHHIPSSNFIEPLIFFLMWHAFASAEYDAWILIALAKWLGTTWIDTIFIKLLFNHKQQRWSKVSHSVCWLKGTMKTVILQQEHFWQVEPSIRKVFPMLHLAFSTLIYRYRCRMRQTAKGKDQDLERI